MISQTFQASRTALLTTAQPTFTNLGRPRLTGTWQVSGRSVVTFTAMANMAMAYLKEQSLPKNLPSVCFTVPAMILGKGTA